MQYFTEDYLEHHGVPEQKWGVRRYQNKDGSLTPRGRKRLKSGSASRAMETVKAKVAQHQAKKAARAAVVKEKKAKEAGHEDFQRARAKKPKQMSTSELKEATDRLKLESQYSELAKKLHKETPKDYVKRVAVTMAKDYGEAVARQMVGRAINQVFGAEVIKGIATKQNVNAGKDLAKMISDEVSRQLNGAKTDENNKKDTPKTNKAKEKIKEAADKIRDKYGEASAAEAAAKALKDQDNMKWARWENDLRPGPAIKAEHVYDGEVVDDEPQRSPYNDSGTPGLVPVYNVRYEKNRRR